MSYTLSVNVIGAKELQEALSSVDGFAKQAIMDAINKTAIKLEQQARANAPHKTGALWNSIHTEPAQATSNNIQAKVGTNLKYARAQELGTEGMTINVRNGRRTRNGGRTKPYSYIGNIPPKLYFKRAMDDIKPEFTNNLQEAATKIVDHLANK